MFKLIIKYKIISSTGLIAYGSVDLKTQNPELALKAFRNEHPEAFIYYAKAIKTIQPNQFSFIAAFTDEIIANLVKGIREG